MGPMDSASVTLYSFLPIECHAARCTNGQACSHHTDVIAHEKKAEVDRRQAQNVHLFYFNKKLVKNPEVIAGGVKKPDVCVCFVFFLN